MAGRAFWTLEAESIVSFGHKICAKGLFWSLDHQTEMPKFETFIERLGLGNCVALALCLLPRAFARCIPPSGTNLQQALAS